MYAILNRSQELDLILSMCPTSLIPGLPFALFTDAMHYVPYTALESKQVPSSVGVTKWYYKPDVDRLLRSLEETRALGPAAVEEWIKGLETAGRDSLKKSNGWELWEARGKLHALGMVKSRENRPCDARDASCEERLPQEPGPGQGTLLTDEDNLAQDSSIIPGTTERGNCACAKPSPKLISS